MSERVLTYKRLGPDATHGFDFEYSTTCLAYLRCEKLHKIYQQTQNTGVKSFFVANNVNYIGAFDDIVIRVDYFEEVKIKPKLIFVQCKHTNDTVNNSDKRFHTYLNDKRSIQKYFDSFLRVHEILHTKAPTENKYPDSKTQEDAQLKRFLDSDFSDCEFVFYSNIDSNSITEFGVFEPVTKNSSDITEQILGTQHGFCLRLKSSERLKCTDENLKAEFCEKFRILLNQKDNQYIEEIHQLLQIDYSRIVTFADFFVKEIKLNFNSSISCKALSENSNVCVKIRSFFNLKSKTDEIIGQYQKNESFRNFFSDYTIQMFKTVVYTDIKYQEVSENPVIIPTMFKDLEKRKIVQYFTNTANSPVLFINSDEDKVNWYFARETETYSQLQRVIVTDYIFDISPPVRKTNEIFIRISCNSKGSECCPDVEEFSLETREQLLSKSISFQGYLQELKYICGNMLNFLCDEKMICEILEKGTDLKLCESLEKPDIYMYRKFLTRTVNIENVSLQKYIKNRFNGKHKLLLFSARDAIIPEVGNSFAWYENIEEVRNVFRAIEKPEHDTIHLCAYSLENIELLYTFEKKAQKKIHKIITEEELLKQLECKKISILSDIAGMGKSTSLKFLAHKYKESYPSHWVFFIELNKHLDKLRSVNTISNTVSAVQFVATKLLSLSKREQRFFINACNETGNVAIFFDAFDEISPEAEKTLPLLLETLEKTKISCLFVSSRLNYVHHLEDYLSQNSIQFVPFDSDENEFFLLEQWEKMLREDEETIRSSDEDIKRAIKTILKQISHKTETINEVLAIPLQMRMIAGIQYDRFKSLLKGELNTEELRISIYDLYNDFCNLHAQRHWIKNFGNETWKNMRDAEKIIFVEEKLEGAQIFAANFIFSELNLLEECNKNVTFKLCDQLGLLTNINPPVFLHRTFAEFLAAKYLVIHLYNKKKENSDHLALIFHNSILLDSKYEILRIFINATFPHFKLNNFISYSIQIPEDDDKNSGLHIAALEGNVEILKTLIEHNHYDVNLRGSSNDTPLNCACTNGNKEAVKYLLGCHECSVNIENSYKRNALHCAAEVNGKSEIIEMLVERDRTLLNKQDKMGFTPLHSACFFNNHEVAKCLLTYPECLINVADDDKRPAFYYALLMDTDSFEIIEMFLKRDRKLLNMKDKSGFSTLLCACIGGNTEMLRQLLTYPEILVNAEDDEKHTALHCAAFSMVDSTEKIDFLLKLDRTLLNKQDVNGMTPLHIACDEENIETAKYLLSFPDCLESILNNEHKSALDYAKQKELTEIIKLILQRVNTGTEVSKPDG